MDIKIEAALGNCDEFIDSIGNKSTISRVIAPLKLIVSDNGQEGNSKIMVSEGCNMWRSCFNPRCWYSVEARENKTSVRKRA